MTPNWYISRVTTPAIQQVHDHVVREIISGRWPRTSRIPSERKLSEIIGLSRMTVRAGLQEAEKSGLIAPSPQRGWYVRDRVLSEPPAELQSFTEMAHALGFTPTSRLVERVVRAAQLDEAKALRLAPSSPVIAITRVRGMDARPVTVEDLVLPFDLVPWLETTDLTNASLYARLAEHGHQMTYSRYTVRAESASAELARALSMPDGAAVLVATETAYNAEGVAVLLGTNHYRGDAYQFTADLHR